MFARRLSKWQNVCICWPIYTKYTLVSFIKKMAECLHYNQELRDGVYAKETIRTALVIYKSTNHTRTMLEHMLFIVTWYENNLFIVALVVSYQFEVIKFIYGWL